MRTRKPTPFWELLDGFDAKSLNPEVNVNFEKALSTENDLSRRQLLEALLLVSRVKLCAQRCLKDEPFMLYAETSASNELLKKLCKDKVFALLELQQQTTLSYLRAKICDFIWAYKTEKNVSHTIGRQALTEYLASAEAAIAEERLDYTLLLFLARASCLSLKFKDSPSIAKSKSLWKKALVQAENKNRYDFIGQSSTLVIGEKLEIKRFHREITARIALALPFDSDIKGFSLQLLRVACSLNAEDSALSSKLKLHLARAIFENSKKFSEKNQGSPLSELDLAVEALKALRKAAAPDELVLEARLHYSSIRTKIDALAFNKQCVYIPEQPWKDSWHQIKSALNKSSSAGEALYLLGSLNFIETQASLREQALHPLKLGYVGSELFLPMILASELRLTNPKNIYSADAAERQEALEFEMHKYATINRQVITRYLISPSIQLLSEKFSEELDAAIYAYVQNSSFVPQNRKNLILRGLLSGANSDFTGALHFLIPHLEACFREQLVALESPLVAVSRDEYKLQVPMLGEVLRELRSVEAYSSDLIFCLEGLLLEEYCGSSLRNGHSHSIFGENVYESLDAKYLWWVVLRLVLSGAVR